MDDDFEENAYLLEYAGKEALCRFWKNEKPPVFWVVRFFRPYDREVWKVILDPSGQVWSFSHSLPEEAKGAMLTQKHALEIAENYLRKEKGINLSEWKLVETNHENLPNRRDWALTYEHKTRKVNDATLRLRVKVQGDKHKGLGFGGKFLRSGSLRGNSLRRGETWCSFTCWSWRYFQAFIWSFAIGGKERSE